MSELCKLWRVHKHRTTAYHPCANGVVERANKGLGDSLQALLLANGEDNWDLLLPHIMRAFRATPHTETKLEEPAQCTKCQQLFGPTSMHQGLLLPMLTLYGHHLLLELLPGKSLLHQLLLLL